MNGYINRNTTENPIRRLNFFSKKLRELSNFGFKFDEQLLRNSMAIGVHEKPFRGLKGGTTNQMEDDMLDVFASVTMSDTTSNQTTAFFDRNYSQKRLELRKFSLNDEIEDIIDILTDESIVYDDNNFACTVKYNGDIKKKVKEEIDSTFKKIYYNFGFADGHTFWDYYRKWLIDGYLAFEIIYDDSNTNIIGFKELDPVTLRPSVMKDKDGKIRKIYVQHHEAGPDQRVILDSNIIYMSYSQALTDSRTSYVERLIRPFNLLRIMEHSRIIWAVTNSSFRMKYIIPIGGKSKTRAKESVSKVINSYKEDIQFDHDSAELKVNGSPMMPFNNEIWLPSKEGESPEVEVIGGEGPDLSDTEALRYFVSKLKDASKIPYNRFDGDNPAGYEVAAEGMMRDEIRFAKFINRLRSKFKQILIKPLYNQLILNNPSLKNDEYFKLNLSISFNKDNVFDELKEYELIQRRIDSISSLRDSLTEQDSDMNDIPYWDLHFLIEKILVEKYFKVTPDDLVLNEKYKEVGKLVDEGYTRKAAFKIMEGEDKKKFKKLAAKSEDASDMDF